MPTKHPRIAVTCDPELERALARSRRSLPPQARRSRAAQVRALALIGAAHVRDPEPEIEDDGEWLRRVHGARPARGDLRTFLDALDLGPVDPDDPYAGQRAVQWAKGDR